MRIADVAGRPSPAATLPASTRVLVAGGGPVGLAAAVELGQRGIECLVIEPRPTVSQARPRCKTISVRSMEHLRRWGLAEQLRKRAPLPVSWSQDIVFCTSLTGRELSRFHGVLGLATDGDRYPEPGQQAPQYVLEELLRSTVDELDAATLATGWRVVGLDQDADGVRVRAVDAAGREAEVTAEYVLGCDGPRSTVRAQIGADYVGEHALRPNFGMVFRAPQLWSHVQHGPAVQYWTVNPAAPAMLGPINRTDTWWIIAFGVEQEVGERTGQQLIQDAVGAPIEAEILSTDPWTARMQLVDRVRSGRVFLAGDAAHLNPPFGGHGLNTGLGDAVDLGWKLAAVLDGWGGPALLDSYEAERRPVQHRVIGEATANMRVLSSELLTDNLDHDDEAGELARKVAGARIQETKHAEFHSLDLVLGIEHEHSPIIPAGPGRGATRSGARLPHTWLDDGVSLYDRLGTGLTLLVLGGPDRAGAGIEQAARACGVPVTTVDLTGHQLRDRYGADLLLVRPDQYVAWLGDGVPADAAALIEHIRGAATPTR